MTYQDIPGYCDFHSFYKEVFDSLPDGAVVAEIGVYLGHSVAYMASLAKESGKDVTIYAIDTFSGSEEHRKKGIDDFYQTFNENMYACGVSDYVRVIRLSSVTASKLRFMDNPYDQFDFVFIDAAHDYDSVKVDIKSWYPLVKKGGIIAGHDYCDSWPGVEKAVDELIPDRQLTSKSVWWKRLEPTS